MSEAMKEAPKRRGRPPRPVVKKAEPKMAAADNFDNVVMTEVVIDDSVAFERPPMRPSIRDEDPRLTAAKRAAEIRGHLLGSMDDGTDEFAAPRPPDGWTYEWKRKTVLGQEDPAYQVHLARMGWEPVPTRRHPEMMPGQGSHPAIERKGMTLMMRPTVISEEARDIEKRRARDQVRAKEAQLNATPDGTLTRDDPRVRPNIKKGFSPIEVPTD